jgi:hypothetical protein
VPATSSNGRTRTIALAVSIPLVVIALLIAAFFFYRHKKARKGRAPDNTVFMELPSEKVGQTVASELAVNEKHRYAPAELEAKRKRTSAVELPGHQVEEHYK